MIRLERELSLAVLAVVLVTLACILAGCAEHPKPPLVPVAVRCAADPGPDPQFVDTSAALASAADIFERVKLLLAGRDQRNARLAEMKAANMGCR